MKTTFQKTWGTPLLLALLTVIGLLAALLGDGGWRVFAWALLAIPLGVIVQKVWLAGNR